MASSQSENEKIEVLIPEDLAPLIPQYLNNKRADLKTLKEALERKDRKTVEEVAHLIKGSGASYGFQSLSTLAAEMESMAKKNDFESLSRLIEKLDHFLSHVTVVYK